MSYIETTLILLDFHLKKIVSIFKRGTNMLLLRDVKRIRILNSYK
jgi:hypothetical protein